MATELNKKIQRESTEEFDGRKINVFLNPDQTVSLKLKGMKTGEVKINIIDLYKQLNGVEESDSNKGNKTSLSIVTAKPDKVSKSEPMIPLNTLRSLNAISTLDSTTMMKFDGIIKEVIDKIKSEK
jgi:hypothetical protein